MCYIIFWGGFQHNKKVEHSHKMMQSGNILIKIRLQILTSVENMFHVAVVVPNESTDNYGIIINSFDENSSVNVRFMIF